MQRLGRERRVSVGFGKLICYGVLPFLLTVSWEIDTAASETTLTLHDLQIWLRR